ncbi:hypothetical protein, partial [Natronobacillus azotifigens]|uniref:hypothetical protein n=1 Tax=Natronobacillus azotifigens TaxID=472978 RepID=UPI003D22213C
VVTLILFTAKKEVGNSEKKTRRLASLKSADRGVVALILFTAKKKFGNSVKKTRRSKLENRS